MSDNNDVQEGRSREELVLMLEGQTARVRELEEVLQSFETAPFTSMRVTHISDDLKWIFVGSGDNIVQFEYPEYVEKQFGHKPQAGDLLITKDGVIVGISPMDEMVYGGTLCIVEEVDAEEKAARVDQDGKITVLIYNPDKIGGHPVKGDRVIVSGIHILRNLGKDDSTQVQTNTGVTWNDIGGLDDAKAQLQEAIVLPFQHPDLYKHYNKKAIKGIMLYGPPGNGKTMLGKAAATELQNLHGTDNASGFLYVKGPEILSKWVGMAELNIRNLFAAAKQFKKDTGQPAVVFIDEADAILGKRGSGVSSDMEKTIVPMFLAEMDGLEETSALVILATNRPDTLDPAVVREGRIDRKINVGRPDAETAAKVLAVHLMNVPMAQSTTRKDIAEFAAKEVFNERFGLYEMETKTKESVVMHLSDLASGAMLAGVVDQATTRAMMRDLENDTRTGISREDVAEAIQLIYEQNRHVDHQNDIKQFQLENNIEHSVRKVTALGR